MTARPSGADCDPPSPNPMAIGAMPQIIAAAVIRIALNRLAAPSRAASITAMFSCRNRSANVISTVERVRHGNSDGHDRSHKGLNVEGRVGRQQHQQYSTKHGRNGKDDRKCQPHRLEIGREQQEDRHDSQKQAGPQSGDSLLQRRNLALHHNLRAPRRCACKIGQCACFSFNAASPRVIP